MSGKVICIDAADIQPKATSWFLEGRIPLGAVTIVAGLPGMAKSLLMTEYAARASRGELPGDLRGRPVVSIIASAEDAPDHVIRPRLQAANADLRMIKVMKVEEENGTTGEISLNASGIRSIEEMIRVHGARMVVIDPVMAYLPTQTNAYRDASVRQVLKPLARIAEVHDVAVVAICHFNKNELAQGVNRVGGSIGFVAAARSVLFVAADPDDSTDTLRVVAHAKSNYSLRAATQRFAVEEVGIDGEPPIKTARVRSLGSAPDITAATLVGDVYGARVRASAARPLTVERAMEFLAERLAGGAVPATIVDQEARAIQIGSRTLERAKNKLRVTSQQQNGRWEWVLPESA